jgi:hypothetical protein
MSGAGRPNDRPAFDERGASIAAGRALGRGRWSTDIQVVHMEPADKRQRP